MLTVKIGLAAFVSLLIIASTVNILNLTQSRPGDINTQTTDSASTSSTVFTTNGGRYGLSTSTTLDSQTTSSSVLTTLTTSSSSSSSGTVNESRAAWDAQWLSIASTAWQFFSPGAGVSPTTGLVYASSGWHRFTDWDLAGYIQAILAAEKLGIISRNGTWGAEYRLNLVLEFLNSRALSSTNIPYQFYDSDTGGIPPDVGPQNGDGADEGRLLIALFHVREMHPELASSIESAIGRVNYTRLISQTVFAGDEYSRYFARGFQLWNYSVSSLPPAPKSVPKGYFVVPEPVVMSILENVSNNYMRELGASVYSAHYSMYNRTGLLVALGEGQYLPFDGQPTPYVYESIEIPNGSSYKIVTWAGATFSNAYPETFTKIALAFYAIYRTGYAQLLANNVTSTLATPSGFEDGFISNSGQVMPYISDNTNNLVMEAAEYAVATY